MNKYEQSSESYYSQHKQRDVSYSLLKFLEDKQDRVTDSKKILEIGCGNASVFEKVNTLCEDSTVLAIDIARSAIETAKEFSKKEYIRYVQASWDDLYDSAEYDLIVDSHLWHCYTNRQQRDNYLAKISLLLKDGGSFLGETMAYNKGLEFDMPYFFNSEESILYKYYKEAWHQQRSILPVYELEQELLKYFSIEYFYIDSTLEFQIEGIKKSHISSLKYICKKS